MNRKILIFTLFAACICTVPALRSQAGTDTPDSGTDAVIRYSSKTFTYLSPTSADEQCVEQITVLRPSGAHKGDFICFTDHTRRLRNFRGTVLDAEGNVLRKLRRSELRHSEFSTSNLADDGAVYYLDITMPTTPYTVCYQYEIAHRGGILTFPVFAPLTSTGTLLEQASYTISLPSDMEFGYKSQLAGAPQMSRRNGRVLYCWSLEQVSALKSEPLSPPLSELVPIVYASPYAFVYGGFPGDLRDWAGYGAWQCGLLEGRDLLPDALLQTVRRLTDHLESDRDKVRTLYRYLGETTRYVSIQLGIGGLQPATAAEVYTTKFGDCKALSNYLHALLKACGIASDYVIVHTQRKQMFRDYASPLQANHAILRVPLGRDTLWLECTDPKLPFGYVHRRIAGHDAVVFRNGTGEVVTIPAYADSLHGTWRHAEISVAEDGGASGSIRERYRAGQYEVRRALLEMPLRERTEYLLRHLRSAATLVQNPQLTLEGEELPVLNIRYDLSMPGYASGSGNRLFLPVSLFAYPMEATERVRQNDLWFETGYCDSTTVVVHIPKHLRVETLPAAQDVETPFGSFSVRAERQGIRSASGSAPPSARDTCAGLYPEYRGFSTARSRARNGSNVLRKQDVRPFCRERSDDRWSEHRLSKKCRIFVSRIKPRTEASLRTVRRYNV